MRKVSLPALLLALALLPSGLASAADSETCKEYVKHATSQAAKDAVAVCGYSGDMWNTTDDVGHSDWCLSHSAATVANEMKLRQLRIEKCVSCKDYATEAVNTYNFNDPEGRIRGAFDGYEWPPMPCGFSGDAWSDNFDGHLRWCVGARAEDIKRETENREALRQICWTCRQYAHKAVVAYHKVWDKCKSFWSNPSMSDPRWSIDHQHHHRWCLGLAADARDASLRNQDFRRSTIVEACFAKVQAPLMIQQGAKAEPRKKVPAEAKRTATKPVAAARQSSGTDTVKSSPAKKQSAGSGSSAMDRLGGGSSGGAGSSGAASAAKSRSGSSVAAPASSATGGAGSGGGGGVALPATSINRNAIGGGGASERIR
jgi:hypothetical protein